MSSLPLVACALLKSRYIGAATRIKRMNEGSLAELQPQIEVGMALLAINGQSMEGVDFEQAKPLVENRPLELVFQR
jgi:C-terminal processing protease CtpA/Prc